MRKFLKGLYIALIVLFLYLPIGTLMVLSFNKSKSMSVWGGFSLHWYEEMFHNPMIMEAIWNTFTIALVSSAIACVIATLACIGIVSMKKRTRTVIMGFNNIPLLNADIVTGISLMMTFLVFGISLSWGTVLLSHITFSIPYVILSVMPKFKQLTGNTYEAALDLGATPVYAFRKVIIPEIRPGIVSGFLLAFTMSVDDFVITHFTRGAGINTISTLIYSQVKVGIRPTLFALSTIIFITVLVILVIFNVVSSKKPGEDAGPEGKAKKVMGIVIAVIFFILLIASRLGASGANGSVHVYAFGDYIEPKLVHEFEAETGIKVIMDTFDTPEEMYPVIKNDSVSYDVICVSDYMIEKLMKEDLLAELNKENLPEIKNMDEKYMKLAESFDPGNRYAVPHTFGTMGILYNTKKIPEGSITSWNDLWKPEYRERMVMPDSMRDTLGIALKAKGYSINTTEESEIRAASDYLTQQKGLVYKYANDSARDILLGGSADIAVIWNGEVLYCRDENPDLAFVIPEEGTEYFTDAWAVPASAKNKANGEKWINFMMGKKASVANFDYLTFSIPNVNVIDSVKDDKKKMTILFPEEELLSKCEPLKSLGPDADDIYSKYWKKFKS